MNTLFYFFFLSIGITFVNCNVDQAQIECMRNGAKALEGKSDDELYNLTQENLIIGQQMVSKRVDTAAATGLPCYKQFYAKYTDGLAEVLQKGEKERLDKAKTPKERSDAIKGLAGITQAMRCDEDWRAANLNQLIEDTKCSSMEQNMMIAMNAKLRVMIDTLLGGMTLGKFGLKLKNDVMSGIVGELKSLFGTVYNEGKVCSNSQSTAADRCHNLKAFINEISRLKELLQIQTLAKL